MTNSVKFKLSNPVHFLALGFGSGLLKPAPGTWGTLSALPIYYLMVSYFAVSIEVYSLTLLLALLLGIYLCGKTAQDVGEHDHGAIVWDEIVGFLVTMFAVQPTLTNVIAGFVLFRFFDILKPWPIKWLDQKVHGGFGIMIDDVLAGIAACVILHLLPGGLLAVNW
jgi:phosphatidylglycerophosphatase A